MARGAKRENIRVKFGEESGLWLGLGFWRRIWLVLLLRGIAVMGEGEVSRVLLRIREKLGVDDVAVLLVGVILGALRIHDEEKETKKRKEERKEKEKEKRSDLEGVGGRGREGGGGGQEEEEGK